jgi:hypothetical protein
MLGSLPCPCGKCLYCVSEVANLEMLVGYEMGARRCWSGQYKSFRLTVVSGQYCRLPSDPLRSLFKGSGASPTSGSISGNTVSPTVKCHIGRRDNPRSNT